MHDRSSSGSPTGENLSSSLGESLAVPLENQDIPSTSNANASASSPTFEKPSSRTKPKHPIPEELNTKKKPRLRTFQECVNWIRHDCRFKVEEFTLVYDDRFDGLMEMPLTYFEVDQDAEEFIPMHRVWLLLRNGEVVWDRKNRIDILGESLKEKDEEKSKVEEEVANVLSTSQAGYEQKEVFMTEPMPEQ